MRGAQTRSTVPFWREIFAATPEPRTTSDEAAKARNALDWADLVRYEIGMVVMGVRGRDWEAWYRCPPARPRAFPRPGSHDLQ